MGATAEDRVSKRRINELEQKLKKLQREIQTFKVERRSLRKQCTRAVQTEAECLELIEELEKEKIKANNEKIKQEDTKYRCRNAECISAGGYYKNTGNCDIIETGLKLIVICQDCGSRYSVSRSETNGKDT